MAAPKHTPPSELLFSLLMTFLTPLFLGGPTGNYDYAIGRLAAIEMIGGFRIRNAWDLFTVVQIVCFSVAGFGSVCLSMQPDLPDNAILRCRSNGNALQRTSDKAQARLDRAQARRPETDRPVAAPLDEAAVAAAFSSAARASHSAAEAEAALRGRKPELFGAEPAQPRPVTPAPQPQGVEPAAPVQATPVAAEAAAPAAPPAHRPDRHPVQPPAADAAFQADQLQAALQQEQQSKLVWAGAMATVAREFADELAHLSPEEQQKHKIRIDALAEVSQKLSSEARMMPSWMLPDGPNGTTSCQDRTGIAPA